MKFQFAELFAGCGGMSIGLDAAGFQLYFANELSPMAGQTFAFNVLGEDLEDINLKKQTPKKTLWIKSKFDRQDLGSRLRENPFEFDHGKTSDLNPESDFKGKLLLGNLDHLLDFLDANPQTKRKLEKLNLDVLSGGPPCQGFSLAGRRVRDDRKNLLPLSFARFAGMVQPKVVMLENVKGITSPFSQDGQKYFAWLEVAKAFSLEGYVSICLMLNSKFFGVPQNRPRFILFAFRQDIFKQMRKTFLGESDLLPILDKSKEFYDAVRKRGVDTVSLSDLDLIDIESKSHLFDGRLFPSIVTAKGHFVSAKKAIDDLASLDDRVALKSINSAYSTDLDDIFKKHGKASDDFLENHERRHHGFLVSARFRLLQLFNETVGTESVPVNAVFKSDPGDPQFDALYEQLLGKPVLIWNEGKPVLSKINHMPEFRDYIKQFASKKHSQRALKSNEPAPAQLTIPDDLCHYDKRQLRTMTVREMARFQSFPDWFVFKSKITTGGTSRSFEVPQYTQVGNAVPPLLAFELGKHIKNLLKRIDNVK